MKRASAVAFVAVLCFATAIRAQTPPETPKPGAEHKRLGYLVGNWTGEADMKASPFGPGGKFTSKDHNEWMPGEFFVVTHSEWKGPMGAGTELAIFGYNAAEKVYTYHAFNSMGEAEAAKGTLDGGTWTWTSEQTMGGKVMKSRFIMKETSATSYTFKFDMAPANGEWSTIMEGKATKTK